jgi:hypothetical protein
MSQVLSVFGAAEFHHVIAHSRLAHILNFTPSLLKKTDGACRKRSRHLYTTTAPLHCIPASYCHLLTTLKTTSITVVNLQDNQAVFRIFITLLNFFIFTLPRTFEYVPTLEMVLELSLSGGQTVNIYAQWVTVTHHHN